MSQSVESLPVNLMKRVREILSQPRKPAPEPVHPQPAREQKWMLKNNEIKWSCQSRNERPHMAANIIKMQLGPTWMTASHMQHI